MRYNATIPNVNIRNSKKCKISLVSESCDFVYLPNKSLGQRSFLTIYHTRCGREVMRLLTLRLIWQLCAVAFDIASRKMKRRHLEQVVPLQFLLSLENRGRVLKAESTSKMNSAQRVLQLRRPMKILYVQ